MKYLKSFAILGLLVVFSLSLHSCKKEDTCSPKNIAGEWQGALKCNTSNKNLAISLKLNSVDSLEMFYQTYELDTKHEGCIVSGSYKDAEKSIKIECNFKDSLMVVNFEEIKNFERLCTGNLYRK